MWRFDSLLAREEERNMAWRGNTWSSSVAYTGK